MAYSIVWTAKAANDKISILKYWIHHNKSTLYSIKLNDIIDEAVEFLAIYPLAGKMLFPEDNIRVKIVKDYWLLYTVENSCIVVLRLWDARQNPKKIKTI
jgi:plasmid stabilization system protein ParE